MKVSEGTSESSATAGVRGAHWGFDASPAGLEITVHPVVASDGAMSSALLARSGPTRTALLLMHPREFSPTHYLVPTLASAGFAVWSQAPRSIGNDLRLEHETALIDVAAGMRALRRLGYESIVLLGNSGGASLLTFYQAEALKAAEERIAATPAGRPTKLAAEDMPAADGTVYLSPHLGQGLLLMASIDPSVEDENDPFSTIPELDPFARENGFARPPQSSHYEPAFVERYRAAQRARVERLDALARNAVATKRAASRAFKAGDRAAARQSAYAPIIQVWRTDADLRNWDVTIEPTRRRVGSLWGGNPLSSNFGSVGFARLCTPESWLSTWSGLSSNASLLKTAGAVTVPTLIVTYDGDPTVFPSEMAALRAAIPAADLQEEVFAGNHHGMPVDESSLAGRADAGAAIAEWLTKRFAG